MLFMLSSSESIDLQTCKVSEGKFGTRRSSVKLMITTQCSKGVRVLQEGVLRHQLGSAQ